MIAEDKIESDVKPRSLKKAQGFTTSLHYPVTKFPMPPCKWINGTCSFLVMILTL